MSTISARLLARQNSAKIQKNTRERKRKNTMQLIMAVTAAAEAVERLLEA